MKISSALTIFLNALLLCPGHMVASNDRIVEAEKNLPFAYDVDILLPVGL